MAQKLSIIINVLAIALVAPLSSCGDNVSDDVIRRYIATHPEEIVASVMKYRDQSVRHMEERQLLRTEKAVGRFSNEGGVVFNPSGKVEITEIVDYNCAFCKSSFSKLEEKLSGDWKDVRLTILPLPILGAETRKYVYLTRIVNKRGGDAPGLVKSLLLGGRVNEALAEKIAVEYKVYRYDLETSAGKGDIAASLQNDLAIADTLSIRATPSFIISGNIFVGYDEAKMSKAIAEARAAAT